MIVAFCGHAQFTATAEYEQKILAFLEEKVGDRVAEMYLGGYGGFDSFAYACCKKYRETHPNTALVLVTPYLERLERKKDDWQRQDKEYNYVLYPEIENRPKRYAILYRNRYMIEKADYVVAYVSHRWGGAYTTYMYAKQKGKPVFNLAESEAQEPLFVL